MSKLRSRLGRGLNSLIAAEDASQPTLPNDSLDANPLTAPPAPPTVMQVINEPAMIPLDKIVANPHQPRRTFDAGLLAQLADSLNSAGLIQPIVVRAVDDHFELIAGERRLRAAKIAGFEAIPALLKDVDATAQAELALVENIQREDLNPIDRAKAYQQLASQLGLTQAELASRLGEERSSVANFLRLLELTNHVQSLVQERQLSLGHAKLLATLPQGDQDRLADKVVGEGLSVRALESAIKSPLMERPAEPKKIASAHIADLEKTISSQIGMRSQVQSGRGGKGKLTIHYASLDQFDELLVKLGVQTQ